MDIKETMALKLVREMNARNYPYVYSQFSLNAKSFTQLKNAGLLELRPWRATGWQWFITETGKDALHHALLQPQVIGAGPVNDNGPPS